MISQLSDGGFISACRESGPAFTVKMASRLLIRGKIGKLLKKLKLTP